MSREYSCPVCYDDVEVPERTIYVTCPRCKTSLGVSVDADFRNGAWHDLTHLYPLGEPGRSVALIRLASTQPQAEKGKNE